jgi:hypothetical protein
MKKLILYLSVLSLLVATPSFAVSRDITLAWDHDKTDLAGFKIYYGTSTGVYSEPVDVGMASKCADSGITPEEFCHVLSIDIPEDSSTSFYFVATAYDASNNESAQSTEAVVVYDYEKPPEVSDLSASFDKASNTLTFSWSYQDEWLPRIDHWSLWDSETSGGPYNKIVDIPYDPNATPPYTTDVVIPAPASSVTKYYVLTTHRGVDNNNAASVDSNEVTVTIDLMPPKSPFEFKIKIR